MERALWISDKVKLPQVDGLFSFLQKIVNRSIVGHLRYGNPDARKCYLSRLKLELKAYQKTGNIENLINVCVYGWLESEAPENPKSHFNPVIDSVTRGVFYGDNRTRIQNTWKTRR